MCFDHVCFRCVFHCFQVYYVWFKSLQRGRPCLISKLGPQGLSNVCEFRRLEVESVGNDIEDVINKQEGPTKFQMNIWCWVSWLAQCWAYDIMILKKWKSWNLEDSGRKEELAQFEPSSRHIRVFPFRNDSGQTGFWASAGLLRWRRSHCCGCRRWWRFACLLGDSWDASDLSGMILESNF